MKVRFFPYFGAQSAWISGWASAEPFRATALVQADGFPVDRLAVVALGLTKHGSPQRRCDGATQNLDFVIVQMPASSMPLIRCGAQTRPAETAGPVSLGSSAVHVRLPVTPRTEPEE
jgi:hypothetical protein